MASYNWGESRVIKIIEGMPENPKERNFWKLLAEHKAEIPKETYNYVFSIFAASVIGENPKLFGFDFDNPLAHRSPFFSVRHPVRPPSTSQGPRLLLADVPLAGRWLFVDAGVVPV